MCVKVRVTKMVCDKDVCDVAEEAAEEEEEAEAGYRIKNKNPTQICGEILYKSGIFHCNVLRVLVINEIDSIKLPKFHFHWRNSCTA